jgi:heptosyltransferase II
MTVAPNPPLLIVRMSNWIGDVVLMLPALERLGRHYRLHLVGKRWLGDLLAAYHWTCHLHPKTWRERVALLRRLRAIDPNARALCVPTSLSSALEFRLAGLPAVGYAKEGRSPLLARALPIPTGVHMADHFARLAEAMPERVGTQAPSSPCPPGNASRLQLTPTVLTQARAAIAQADIRSPFVVICPFASGAIDGQDKRWPGFPALVQALRARSVPVLACPGPGEEGELRIHSPDVVALSGLSVAAYAGVLAHAACVVANDTGPGHLAAALGVPLVSVLGPTDPTRWGARGPRVHLLRSWPAWPETPQVLESVLTCLRSPPGRP